MLQIETNGRAAEQTSRSVTTRTKFPILLLQIETQGPLPDLNLNL